MFEAHVNWQYSLCPSVLFSPFPLLCMGAFCLLSKSLFGALNQPSEQNERYKIQRLEKLK